MKKIILLFLAVYSFAVKDYLLRPKLSDYSFAAVLPKVISNYIDEDSYNKYLYGKHFKVIYGIDYKDNAQVKALAENILEIAENVWQKEIEEFGFKPPRNSENNYIDIYIGNKSAYNDKSGSYITIESYYAGYATAYADGTPYFVINPSVSLSILKVTIAHEFFHTVQYAYGFDSVDESIWYKNIWFLEASAVMMEDEVFDDVNDYQNYLDYYLPYTNFPIDYYNGGIEYGKVLFAKYLKEKYGMDFIKKIFENYETNETVLDNILSVFKKENIDFNSFLLDYGVCLADLYNCFSDEDIVKKPSFHSLEENASIYKYGLLFVKEGESYLTSDTPYYAQEDFEGSKNIISDISSNGLIVLNKTTKSFNTDILEKNYYNNLQIHSGWNLISNYTDVNISLNELGGNIIWIYRNGHYFAYSNDEHLQKVILKRGYAADENFLKPGEGAWIYSKEEYEIPLNNFSDNIISYNKLNLFNGWNLVFFSSNAIDLNKIDENVLIWNYDNGWKYYSKSINIEGIEKLKYIIPGKGYFIYKN